MFVAKARPKNLKPLRGGIGFRPRAEYAAPMGLVRLVAVDSINMPLLSELCPRIQTRVVV